MFATLQTRLQGAFRLSSQLSGWCGALREGIEKPGASFCTPAAGNRWLSRASYGPSCVLCDGAIEAKATTVGRDPGCLHVLQLAASSLLATAEATVPPFERLPVCLGRPDAGACSKLASLSARTSVSVLLATKPSDGLMFDCGLLSTRPPAHHRRFHWRCEFRVSFRQWDFVVQRASMLSVYPQEVYPKAAHLAVKVTGLDREPPSASCVETLLNGKMGYGGSIFRFKSHSCVLLDRQSYSDAKLRR